jgi:two-component system sensor histidine kinase MtrB
LIEVPLDMPSRRSPVSLRTTISAGIALLAGLAGFTALVLVSLTAHLRHVGAEVASGIESVRVVEEAEVELLLHAREADPARRSEHARNLRLRLEEAGHYVTTDEEQRLLESCRHAIQRYLHAPPIDTPDASELAGSLSEAFRSTEALININVVQSQDALRHSAEADRMASVLGVITIAVLLPLVPLLVWWLWRRALEPLFELGRAMERFTAGDRSARARGEGPLELRRMAERFNDMAAELSRQRERQMAFLAGVAHDLRTPLSALKIATSIFSADGPPGNDAASGKMMELSRRQVDRMDRMVGDLLEITRIEAGQLELRLEPTDARGLAKAAVDLFEPTAPSHRFQVVMPEEPQWVECDPARVEQVLNNLVSNAIKYSPGGSAIRVTVASQADDVVLSVADEGQGIPENEQTHLFEPFRRSTLARASSIPGVGLGLFVANRIVTAHQGRIEVRSAPGQGSTFSVFLKASPAPRPTIEQRELAESKH